MTTMVVEKKKFVFRPSWLDAVRTMKSPGDRLTALVSICQLGVGESVDTDSLPENVRILMTQVHNCLDFDQKQEARRQDSISRWRKGQKRKPTRKRDEVNEVSEADEVNEVNEVCEASEANEVEEEENISSSSEEEEEAKQAQNKNLFREMICEAHDYWNVAIDREHANLRRVKPDQIGPSRCNQIGKRLQQFGLANFKKAVDNAASSQFLNNEANGAPFSFDWFLRYDNFCKVLEGNYQKCYRVKPLKAADDMPTKEDIENDKGLIAYD